MRTNVSKLRETAFQTLVLGILITCLHVANRAEQLPLKSFTVADGLASNLVNHIFQDRKGFVWLATGEGLSLFDGYGFRNFDEGDGLPAAPIRFVTEDDNGRLWVGTFRGLARIDESPAFDLTENGTKKKRFTSFRISDGDSLTDKVRNQISRIMFHTDGSLWCLTDYGLYKTANPDSDEPKFETIVERDTAFSGGAFRDGNGSLWFGLGDELFEIRGAEAINRGSVGVPFPKNLITAIVRDNNGRLLVSDINNLYEVLPTEDNDGKFEFRQVFSVKDGATLNATLADSQGRIWFGTENGLIRLAGNDTSEIGNFSNATNKIIRSLANDQDGNLWIGLSNSGVRILESEAIVNFVPDRNDSIAVGDVLESPDGKIWAMLNNFDPAMIENGELVEKEFGFAVPASPSAYFVKNKTRWSYSAQNHGLIVKDPKLRLRNGRIFEVSKYVDSETQGSRFYEDENGVLWIANRDGMLRRRTPDGQGGFNFESFPLETPFSFFASRLIGDGAGGLWLAHPLFLGRFRNGVYSPAGISEGLPEKDPRSVFRDSRGWLWIGLRNKGVSVTVEPAAENPNFVNYSKANSPMRSNAVRAITEDDKGRVYFATDNGISRLDPTNNEWTHFSSKTGLAGDMVFGVYKDSKGFVWASTEKGLSRMDTRLERRPSKLSPTYITRIVIAGKDVMLPTTGAAQVPRLELAWNEGNLSISFVAPNFRDDGVHYQYRLGETDWSQPAKESTVSFSNLAAGDYRFEVRVTGANGTIGSEPAVFEFRILRPVWQRWWFLLGIIVLVGFLIYWLYRLRVSRLLEIERTRTRIATDLHDHIGTNLSKISLLSEILKMQIADENRERTRMLDVIGETSRESVGAMSDIVWAINPEKDTLADITRRMRQHAEEVFLDRGVKVNFRAPEDGKDLKLSMEIRRELYLIFKEAIANAAKHSDCRNIEIDFQAQKNNIFLHVKDDGYGFDIEQDTNGNGLKNLKARGERMGAKIQIQSAKGKGTSVSVDMKR